MNVMFAGMALMAGFERQVILGRAIGASSLGLTTELVDATLKIIAAPLEAIRSSARDTLEAEKRESPFAGTTAFRASALRRFPIITVGKDELRAPLPELIGLRITAGLFYDIASGPTEIRNGVSARFEDHCRAVLAALAPEMTVLPPTNYTVVKGRDVATPDARLLQGDQIELIVECKITKLSIAAQFAENPYLQAEPAHRELAKAVFQIWRYFSHVRIGLDSDTHIADTALGLVVTLDPWLSMAREQAEQVIADAHKLADAERRIEAVDRRYVAFCTVSDLEQIYMSGPSPTLLAVLRESASEDRFRHWELKAVHSGISTDVARRKYPFDLGRILPWWQRIDEAKAAQNRDAPAERANAEL